MERNELMAGMRILWKRTFGDPDSYLDLIFDDSFDPELSEYVEEEGRIVSMLLAFPYRFASRGESIMGLYLCGLATDPKFQGKGMMTKLMSNIETKAIKLGYSFTFLIPASNELRFFYSERGYYNAIYKVESYYTSVHNFQKEIYGILCNKRKLDDVKRKNFEEVKIEKYDDGNSIIKDKIIKLISAIENNENKFTSIIHSTSDINKIIKENNLSFGEIYCAILPDGNLNGVAFIIPDNKGSIKVQKMYAKDELTRLKILEKIKIEHSQKNLIVTQYPEESTRKVLWSEVYGSESPDAPGGGAYGIAERVYDVSHHSKPFGMAKILNVEKFLEYLSNVNRKEKIKLILDSGENYCEKFEAWNGQMRGIKIPRTDPECLKSGIIRLRDFSEILFRRVDSSPIIEEAFGIPRLGMNVALMME